MLTLEKTIMLEKAEGSKKSGRPDTRCIDSLKEVTGLNLQELNRAVEDGTFWSLLIHRVTIGWR